MVSFIEDFLSWAQLGIPSFLLVITVVVFVHELGHFLVGRLFGVKIETFSIGFGREIIGWSDRKGTRWKVGWLPLGGYVRFAGDIDAASRPADLRHASKKEREGMLQFKPLPQRALVVAAGPLANFLLAAVVFAGMFLAIGKPAAPPVVDSVLTGSPAAEAGILVGDTIRAVNGKPVGTFFDLQRVVVASPGHNLTITLSREGAARNVVAVPRREVVKDRAGQSQVIGRLGITNRLVSVGALEAMSLGADQTWYIIDQTLRYIGGLFLGEGTTRELSGPLGIARISGDVAQEGLVALVSLIAILSVSIGLLNLFPIPVLDGGHLLYYAFEAVLGRPLGARAQEVGFRLGLALIVGLILIATFNDLVRLNLF
ncbi:MAG: RIP metalloprotease RseP [Alphaproteobacteria bacterium]